MHDGSSSVAQVAILGMGAPHRASMPWNHVLHKKRACNAGPPLRNLYVVSMSLPRKAANETNEPGAIASSTPSAYALGTSFTWSASMWRAWPVVPASSPFCTQSSQPRSATCAR